MYSYHDSQLNKDRLAADDCRCSIEHSDRVFDLENLIRNQQLFDPYSTGTLLGPTPTVPPEATEAYTSGTYIYAVSSEYETRVALDCDRSNPNAVKHETLFHNEDVLAAGEMKFDDGFVAYLDDQSGSYGTKGALQTDPDFVEALLTAFSKAAIPVKPELMQTLSDKLEPQDG